MDYRGSGAALMSMYYLDASAIVKRYLRESGSRWVTELWEQVDADSLSSVELVDVEVVCALSRAQREGRIGMGRRNQAAALFVLEAKRLLDRIPLSADVVQGAHRLALRHPLRAYDALHLATALKLAGRLMWSGLPAPIFVSADGNLLAAARAEGLAAENPNEHE
jgi:predicted nucleic acid-binding protein